MTSYKEALQKVLKTSKKNKVKIYTKDLNNEVLAEISKQRKITHFIIIVY